MVYENAGKAPWRRLAIALGKIADKSILEELKKIAEEYPEITTRRAILESVEKMSR